MIGYYNLSLIGTSHQSMPGGVCQDYSDVKVLQNGWIVGAIADGLGSAKHSEIGARTAVETVLSFIGEHMPEEWDTDSLTALLRVSFHEALKAVQEIADVTGESINSYDTTLTVLIYSGLHAVYGHVGDGGIIALSPFGEYSLLTQIQKGEAHNETYPLRSGPRCWTFGASKEEICALLMMTDGMLDAAMPWLLARQEQKIYIKFVRLFMDNNLIGATKEEDFVKLKEGVRQYLETTVPKMMGVTDDKTVLGIINTDEMPEILDESYYAEPDWEALHKEHNDLLYGRTAAAAVSEAEMTEAEPENEPEAEPEILSENAPEHQTAKDDPSGFDGNMRQAKQPNLSIPPRPAQEIRRNAGNTDSTGNNANRKSITAVDVNRKKPQSADPMTEEEEDLLKEKIKDFWNKIWN